MIIPSSHPHRLTYAVLELFPCAGEPLLEIRLGDPETARTLLADAHVRNFAQWPVLNQYVWANNYVGGSYENEINYLRNWIFDRIAWMDSKLDGYMYPLSSEMELGLEALDLNIFPNPVDEQFHLAIRMNSDSELRLEVVNLLGQVTYRELRQLHQGPQLLQFSSDAVRQAMPESGIYLLKLYVNEVFIGSKKIMKQ